MTIIEMLILYLTMIATGFGTIQIFDNKGRYDLKYKAIAVFVIIIGSIIVAYVVYSIINFRGG